MPIPRLVLPVLCAALLVGVLLAGCAAPSNAPRSLEGTSWQLVTIDDTLSVPSDLRITATFTREGRLNGQSGCNQYAAPYTAANDSLRIGRIKHTRRVCTPARMAWERRLITLLPSVRRYQIRNDSLRVMNGAGRHRLTFVALSASDAAHDS